ncbi:unnamed protein product [Echinostoma caproni]|uniref:WD_REPEATS_REGION domain-containing protein n=1 Tax=Echinostoma caproni TaxID=27848 RepID=A0A183A3A3_9TREM|nr:unnamed protein product [Echinostoma caproni]
MIPCFIDCNPTADRPARGDLSVLTLRGHSVRFSHIRARFSPRHSTGQRFAYAGSACGVWQIWDLFTGKRVSYYYLHSPVTMDTFCWAPGCPVFGSVHESLTRA